MPSSIWQFGNLHVDLTQVARLFNLLFCILHFAYLGSSDISGTHHLSKHHIVYDVKITPLYDVFNTGIITSRNLIQLQSYRITWACNITDIFLVQDSYHQLCSTLGAYVLQGVHNIHSKGTRWGDIQSLKCDSPCAIICEPVYKMPLALAEQGYCSAWRSPKNVVRLNFQFV